MSGARFPLFFRLSAIPLSDNFNACDFSILTTIASPIPEVISTLNNEDNLVLTETDASRVLQIETIDRRVCGVLLGRTRRIISCMAQGIKFSVKVILVNGAECQILVQSINEK